MSAHILPTSWRVSNSILLPILLNSLISSRRLWKMDYEQCILWVTVAVFLWNGPACLHLTPLWHYAACGNPSKKKKKKFISLDLHYINSFTAVQWLILNEMSQNPFVKGLHYPTWDYCNVFCLHACTEWQHVGTVTLNWWDKLIKCSTFQLTQEVQGNQMNLT